MPRAGGDSRGSSYDRKRRKQWMLEHFGNGKSCRCTHCSARLVLATLEADRILPGGSYARGNIQPACRACNASRSDNPNWVSPVVAAKRAARRARYAAQRTAA